MSALTIAFLIVGGFVILFVISIGFGWFYDGGTSSEPSWEAPRHHAVAAEAARRQEAYNRQATAGHEFFCTVKVRKLSDDTLAYSMQGKPTLIHTVRGRTHILIEGDHEIYRGGVGGAADVVERWKE